MKPFYDHEKRAKRLLQYLDTWIGTPYHHLGETPGRWSNCSFFIGHTMLRLGAIKKFEHEKYYPRDWSFTNEEVILNTFLKTMENLAPGLSCGLVESPMIGDMIFFSIRGKLIDHMGIFVSEKKFIHGIQNHGVNYSTFGNYWKNRTRKIYRIWEIQ